MTKLSESNTQLVTVNYNTPDLVIKLYQSIVDNLKLDLHLTVVDGSNSVDTELNKLSNTESRLHLINMGSNIHHGPGLHFGILHTMSKFIIVVDTDVTFDNNYWIDQVNKTINDIDIFYGVGNVQSVDRSGHNTTHITSKTIKYLHPHLALLNTSMYRLYKPFIRHGAPCISAMTDLHDKGHGYLLIDIPATGYTHVGRSTLKRHNNYLNAPTHAI